MKRPRHRSETDLLRIVERLFLREILTFEGERHIGLRVDGVPPDRSVFAAAMLGDDGTVAVARAYESDLDDAPDRPLQLVYMTAEDFELFRTVIRRASLGWPIGGPCG